MLVIIILVVLGCVALGIYLDAKTRKELKQEEQQFQMALTEITDSYGEPTIEIFAPCYSIASKAQFSKNIENYFMVFEPTKTIALKGKLYNFSQITGYTVSVNNKIVSSSTSASTGSVLGRAALGGALFGGVGAIIGAASAKNEADYETHEETVITIFTNSLSEPSVILDLIVPEKETVAQIEGILRIITKDTI